MTNVVKITWIAMIILSLVALLWFAYLVLFRITAIGPGTQLILMFVWIPTLIFVVISIVLLTKGKAPASINSQICFVLFIVIFSLVFPVTLLREPGFERQQREIAERNRQSIGGVFSEERRTTSDGKYEYRLSISGIYTENPSASLVITNTATNGTRVIPIDFSMEVREPLDELSPDVALVKLSPTDEEFIYVLTTTLYFKEEIEIFEINVRSGSSRRLE